MGANVLNRGVAADDVQNDAQVTVIEPRAGWRLVDVRELVYYRDLLWFLTYQIVRTRYAQSALGIGWAVIQPVLSMVVFTIIFGKLAKIASDGVPYALFSFTGLVPWTFFAAAVSQSTASLAGNAAMLSKIYFPRLILPISTVLARLVDLAITLVVLLGLMALYGFPPTRAALFVPVLLLVMVLAASGIGLWLSALAVQYRDISYGIGFVVQLGMYAAPVVYPVSLIPERFQPLYAIYPMVGVIEGMRAALLATRPMPWDLVAVSGASALVLFVTGALYFRRRESVFADVV